MLCTCCLHTSPATLLYNQSAPPASLAPCMPLPQTCSLPHRPQVETSLLRLGEQQTALEGVAATAEVVSALATGAAANRATMQQLGVEQVEAIVEDMAETADEARLVQDALALPLGAAAELDEGELEAELQVGQRGYPSTQLLLCYSRGSSRACWRAKHSRRGKSSRHIVAAP